MSARALPGQFDFAAQIFCGETTAAACRRRFVHCDDVVLRLKNATRVVALQAPRTFLPRAALDICGAGFPSMPLTAFPEKGSAAVLIFAGKTASTALASDLTQLLEL